mmetsp:Transcript_7299/g.16108  ORF Transcript_7299/g.16108 Transcript_7299/m.16108 type:complete len:96 (+) Transcript_7299:663-950(+)
MLLFATKQPFLACRIANEPPPVANGPRVTVAHSDQCPQKIINQTPTLSIVLAPASTTLLPAFFILSIQLMVVAILVEFVLLEETKKEGDGTGVLS